MAHAHLREAIKLAIKYSQKGNNGPFGAIIVLDDKVIGKGWNQVVELNDPTAHAEVIAIRNACNKINSYDLTNAILYSSCEPCPMCLSAIYWSRIKKVVYACSRYDAANIGFDDKVIYDEFTNPQNLKKIKLIQSMEKEGKVAFDNWKNNPEKIMY